MMPVELVRWRGIEMHLREELQPFVLGRRGDAAEHLVDNLAMTRPLVFGTGPQELGGVDAEHLGKDRNLGKRNIGGAVSDHRQHVRPVESHLLRKLCLALLSRQILDATGDETGSGCERFLHHF